MKLGILVTTKNPEKVWNMFRLANLAVVERDDVKIFFMSDGVEYDTVSTEKYDILKLAKDYLNFGGKLFACTTCMERRKKQPNEYTPLGTLKDLYAMIKESDKLLSF